MTLAPGSKLGPYEIVAPLGAGGMGEVWRARDTRLERTVAIKVLPATLSQNAQLKLRFEREAKTISQLTHPHICTLFDVGHEGGIDFLVMEHLEGESLADRLAKGPLPFDQVLRIGAEIAEALERAHRAGVVHRDLKPGNIMLTKSGAKLLDFGLAKAAASPVLTPDDATVQKAITEEGTIVGTFHYMAPEQLEGRDADARTDLFALGAVLYEMATGKRAFEAKSRASLIAAILDREPEPISNVQPLTPASFEHIVSRCLAKDPDERWQTAHDVRLQLEWLRDARSGVAPAVAARRRTRDRVAWAMFAIAALAALAFGALYARKAAEPKPVVAASIQPPENLGFAFVSGSGGPALSPDGSRIVFSATNGTASQLWLRTLEEAKAQPIPGTEDASFPFWSDDGLRIAFFADRKLKKLTIGNAVPTVVCDAPLSARGGSWRGDTIVFGTRYDGLYRVSAAGGNAQPLTQPEPRSEATHRWPVLLPDGEHVLYLASPTGASSAGNAVWVAPLARPANRKLLVKTPANVAVAGDYLVFVRDRALVAQKFDAKALALTGEPLPVAPAVSVDSLFSRALFDATAGTLVLQSGGAESSVLLSVHDRKGAVLADVPVPGPFGGPALSPDEKSIALSVLGSESSNVWIIDRTRGTASKLTFGTRDTSPTWSPDGKWIAYSRLLRDIVLVPSDGSHGERVVTTGQPSFTPTGWSPDGRYLIIGQSDAAGTPGLSLLTLADGSVRPLVPRARLISAISPDGQWLAYSADETGRPEVYLTRFPGASGKWQVSSGGGRYPRWSRDGKQLYFLGAGDVLHTVSVTVEAGAPALGKPEPLFPVSGSTPGVPYDVASDGTFLVSRPVFAESSEPLQLITNWQEKLRRR